MNTENHKKRFRLISLEIFPKCEKNIRKILQPGKYRFEQDSIENNSTNTEYMSDKMYGKRISIHVIVGKNGSGKTSLLDVVYRLINNFSYYLMRDLKHTQSSGKLSFVHGVYAKLEYFIDGELWYLESKGTDLALYSKEGRGYRVGKGNIREWVAYEKVNDADAEKVREVMKHFFYTIVTNYSFNSFLSSDYDSELTEDYNGPSWIDNLFHKNDGYRTPIVLNPYRDKGLLDVQQETDFAISRTIAILLQFQNSKQPLQFIDGYSLHSVTYKFDATSFWRKFVKYLTVRDKNAKGTTVNKLGELNQKKIDAVVSAKFKRAFDDQNTYANWILKILRISPDSNNQVQFASCCYLVYKIFSILGNYPVYEKYSYFGDLSFCFKKMSQSQKEKKANCQILKNAIIELTQDDNSHITYKLRLTLRFLKGPFAKAFPHSSQAQFELSDYLRIDLCNNVEQIMEALPITLFKPTIILRRNGKKNEQDVLVPFTSLSSGEKLFTYTLGTIVYHVLNLKSVDSRRIHYRNINIVMDELEMCFHPEMQRQFVNKLITTIQRLRLNLHCHFNLLLVTHSPFILSDVPDSKIMYLKDGKDVSDTITVNPFGTNINNVLSQNFFLGENGFVGDIAYKNISTLVDFLNTSKNEVYRGWNIQLAEYFIDNIIGDDVIKHFLSELLTQKKNTAEQYETNIHNS